MASPSSAATVSSGVAKRAGKQQLEMSIGEGELCGECELVEAELECEECQEFYCKVCSGRVHAKGRRKLHNTKAIGSNTSPKCDEHEGEKLSLYCTSCQTIVCARCLLFGHHANHPYKPVEDVFAETQDRIRDKAMQLQKNKQKIESFIDLMEFSRGQIQKQSLSLQDGVRSKMAELRRVLEEKEEELISSVHRLEKAKVISMERFSEEMRGRFLSLKENLNAANSILSGTHAADFMQFNSQLETSIDALNTVKLEAMEGHLEQFSATIDITKQLESIQSLEVDAPEDLLRQAAAVSPSSKSSHRSSRSPNMVGNNRIPRTVPSSQTSTSVTARRMDAEEEDLQQHRSNSGSGGISRGWGQHHDDMKEEVLESQSQSQDTNEPTTNHNHDHNHNRNHDHRHRNNANGTSEEVEELSPSEYHRSQQRSNTRGDSASPKSEYGVTPDRQHVERTHWELSPLSPDESNGADQVDMKRYHHGSYAASTASPSARSKSRHEEDQEAMLEEMQKLLEESNATNMGPSSPLHRPSLQPSNIQGAEQLDDELRRIFVYYCSFGEPSNTEHMGNAKFYKLVRECRLLDTRLTYPDVDLVFIEVLKTASSSAGGGHVKDPRNQRLHYDNFCKALALLASKKFGHQYSPEDSLSLLLSNYILPLASRTAPDATAEELLDPAVVALFDKYHKNLYPIFSFYIVIESSKMNKPSWNSVLRDQNLMSHDKFLRFAKDFDIFPDLLSKAELSRIFRATSCNHSTDDLLSYPEFMEALGRCALQGFSKHPFDIKYPTVRQKVELLLERHYMDVTNVKKLNRRMHNIRGQGQV